MSGKTPKIPPLTTHVELDAVEVAPGVEILIHRLVENDDAKTAKGE